MFELDRKIISWAQYLQWADINYNRYICDEENTTTEEIAKCLQWFASEYVVIDGWTEIKATNEKIDKILTEKSSSIQLLRRARNAVYHYQKKPLDKRLIEFVSDFSHDSWLIDLHEFFLMYLLNYPASIYPYEERKEEFVYKFYEVIGWKPYVSKTT